MLAPQWKCIEVPPAGRGDAPQAPYYSRGPPSDDRFGPRMDERWGNGRQYAPREDAHDRCVVGFVLHSAVTNRLAPPSNSTISGRRILAG